MTEYNISFDIALYLSDQWFSCRVMNHSAGQQKVYFYLFYFTICRILSDAKKKKKKKAPLVHVSIISDLNITFGASHQMLTNRQRVADRRPGAPNTGPRSRSAGSRGVFWPKSNSSSFWVTDTKGPNDLCLHLISPFSHNPSSVSLSCRNDWQGKTRLLA